MDPSDLTNVDAFDATDPQRHDLSAITQPFDPKRIRMRTHTVVASLVISRIDQNALDLSPDFQRKRGIWNREKRSRFIESLLLRIPIPMFYVAEDEEENWIVIDGIQRISTIYDYVKGKFDLRDLEYLPYQLQYYDNLPPSLQRRISETQLSINVVEPETPEEVRYNIFRRINTGGMLLNNQELRNALYQGPVRSYLRDLADTDEFLSATRKKIPALRMKDRESILRFFSFRLRPWRRYEGVNHHDFHQHLNNTMGLINKMDDRERSDRATEFRKAMNAAKKIFEDSGTGVCQVPRAFPQETSTMSGATSLALFETWSVLLAVRKRKAIETLVKNRCNVLQAYNSLFRSDRGFCESVTVNTWHPQNIRKRYQAIGALIKEYGDD